MEFKYGIGYKIQLLTKILASQNSALRKITNALLFSSNLTLHKDSGIKTVNEDACLHY